MARAIRRCIGLGEQRLRLDGKVIIVTGGSGLLGQQHIAAITEAGGIPVNADLRGFQPCDVTDPASIQRLLDTAIRIHGRVDGLVNNAAHNPKVEDGVGFSRLETLTLEEWYAALDVGLTGAFLCSQIIGKWMAAHEGGVILNIASVLSVIAPDQRLYRKPGLPDDQQPVKPVTYSVEKAGLLGLTHYLATYWPNVRCNALSPAGVYAGQPQDFVEELTKRIPMGRMARPEEYREAMVFLLSDASAYMTGHNLIFDGGMSVW